jgi:hypothetical protein
MTKEEAFIMRAKDGTSTADFALPQPWLDSVSKKIEKGNFDRPYDRILCQFC